MSIKSVVSYVNQKDKNFIQFVLEDNSNIGLRKEYFIDALKNALKQYKPNPKNKNNGITIDDRFGDYIFISEKFMHKLLEIL